MRIARRMVFMSLLLALLGPILAGCAQEEAQADVAQSDAARTTSPDVNPADIDTLVAGNSTFAFDLYQALREKEGNLFFSPYSISSALAMTFAGARDETQQQMAATLHFDLPQERLHPAFNALDLALRSQEGEAFQLHIANSLWGQTGYTFLEPFLDVLARNYGAGLRLLDFRGALEPSRQTINDWVSEQTEEKIQDLIPPGGVSQDTRLVLANAIYFDAEWLHPFEKEQTQDGTFNTLEGEQVTVPMMKLPRATTLSYAKGEGVQAIQLPYKGDQMAMLILVPDSGQFEAFESTLDAGRVATLLEQLASRKVVLQMPKFRYRSEFSLAPELSGMGMPDAFGPSADFAGMDGTQELFISDVFHKAFVAVDEAGTEAAAATGVVVGITSLPVDEVRLTIDRPFIYMIRDLETGTVLFVGRVLNPAQ